MAHPAVKEVEVSATADEKWGELVTARVVEETSAQTHVAHCRTSWPLQARVGSSP